MHNNFYAEILDLIQKFKFEQVYEFEITNEIPGRFDLLDSNLNLFMTFLDKKVFYFASYSMLIILVYFFMHRQH